MSRPRVLVLGLNYAPELTGIAPYTAGMAAGLTQDFDVDVVTAHPHYPEWKIASGYGGWRSSDELDGVRVHRVKHYLPRNPTGLGRIVSEATFTARALAPGVTRPDAIITVSPALAPVASALALGRRWDVPVGVVVQDLYSKAFAELGLLGGRLDGRVHRLERSLLHRAHGVVAIHERMADVIARDFDVPRSGITVIPNWTHVSPPTKDRDARRCELGWDDGRFTVVHAGNMGAKQGLEHLIPAARLLDEQRADVRIVLIGNGGQRGLLEESARGVRSIEFMDALPTKTFMDTLAAADALLLHEKPGMKEMCVPSKLTTYFAARRPVIAVTEAESAAAHEVTSSQSGLLVRPGEPKEFVAAVATIQARETAAMGEAGFAYAVRELSEVNALIKYRHWVSRLMSGR